MLCELYINTIFFKYWCLTFTSKDSDLIGLGYTVGIEVFRGISGDLG